MADRPVSFFSSRRGAALCRCIPQCPPKNGQPCYHSFPLKSSTLRQADNYARTNAEAGLLTDQVRALEPGTPAYSDAKARLCSDLPGGVVSPFRAKQHMIVNGVAYCELDNAYDIAVAREALAADPSIARAALSPGGNGLHVVVPVLPEPTTVAELHWALEQIHGHMVCRYGKYFAKLDKLTTGIEFHNLASDPGSIFRETALPLMTGAPPARYTEGRRRVVTPGFGDGVSRGGLNLGPFQDTTDPVHLAWRDATRRRIQAALEYLPLPDGSRNDVWIPAGFCLVGAELEGRALYEVSIGARDLFVDWTRAAAYPGSTKLDSAGGKFDELAADFDLDRARVGSLEGLYARARAAGWNGKISSDGDQESTGVPGPENECQDGAGESQDDVGFGDEPEDTGEEAPKRGRGRPKGSRNRSGSARQAKEERQDAETKAVSAYIAGLKNANSAIYWLGEYYTLRESSWAYQSPEFYELEIKRRIEEARGTDTPVITARLMSDYLGTLQRELLPAVVDTALLDPEDRLRNFNIDTGQLISGVAFPNALVTMDESGRVSYQERRPRDFYSTSRPYALPQEDPGRPEKFDAWLEEMVPAEGTRTAIWECLGMTVMAQGYIEQRLVFLCAGARSGKGTLEKVAAKLTGGFCAFSGGPARLGASAFTNSALVGRALCILPDSPAMAENPRTLTVPQYIAGLSTIKNLTGEDPVTVEFKGGRVFLSLVWPGTLWWDSNHRISRVIPATDDAHSWRSRVIPIPMTVELTEEEQVPTFHQRFEPEISCIAYHAIQAYAERRRRGAFTFSAEMHAEVLKVGEEEFQHLALVSRRFVHLPGACTSRAEIRGLAEDVLERPPRKRELTHLYRAACAAGGTEVKTGGNRGFHDLSIDAPSPPESGAPGF